MTQGESADAANWKHQATEIIENTEQGGEIWVFIFGLATGTASALSVLWHHLKSRMTRCGPAFSF
jgi:hypothetical protein